MTDFLADNISSLESAKTKESLSELILTPRLLDVSYRSIQYKTKDVIKVQICSVPGMLIAPSFMRTDTIVPLFEYVHNSKVSLIDHFTL